MPFEIGFLSIIIALIRRGRIRLLADLDIKGLWFLAAAVFIIIASSMSEGYMDKAFWVRFTGWLAIASSLAIFAFLWVNRKLPGVKWFIAGYILNLFPIIFNAGKMPVLRSAARMAGAKAEEMLTQPDMMRHVVMSTSTKFNFLADIFGVSKPFPEVFSIGDILMSIGMFILIQMTMCPRKPKLSKEPEEGQL